MQIIIDLLREGAEMKALCVYREKTNQPLYETIVDVVAIANEYKIPIPLISQTKPAKESILRRAA